MRSPLRRFAGLVLWLGGLSLVIVVLLRLGQGELAAPPLEPGKLQGWVADRDAATMIVALVRLAALVAAAYLSLTTVVGLLLRLCGAAAAVRVADALTAPVVRRVLAATMGLTLAAGPALSMTPAWAADTAPPVTGPALSPGAGGSADTAPVMRLLEPADPPDRAPSPPRVPARPAPPPTLAPPGTAPSTPSPPPSAPPLARETPPPTAAPERPAAAPVPTRPAPGPSSWTVRAGDHLWLVAATVVRAQTGRTDETSVATYWERLIELNRSNGRLPDPDNPSLLFPGIQLDLPPL